MSEIIEIEEGAILKVWTEGENGNETPWGFNEGYFTVDTERRYIQIWDDDGDLLGLFFSMFSYVPHPETEEMEETEDIRGYN